MKLSKREQKLLQDFADNQDDVRLRLNYSGRGMFGRECIGFISSESPFSLGIQLATFLTEKDEHDLLHPFESVKHDSMCQSTIIYFHRIEQADVDEYEDEDDEDEDEDEDDKPAFDAESAQKGLRKIYPNQE